MVKHSNYSSCLLYKSRKPSPFICKRKLLLLFLFFIYNPVKKFSYFHSYLILTKSRHIAVDSNIYLSIYLQLLWWDHYIYTGLLNILIQVREDDGIELEKILLIVVELYFGYWQIRSAQKYQNQDNFGRGHVRCFSRFFFQIMRPFTLAEVNARVIINPDLNVTCNAIEVSFVCSKAHC